MSTNGHGKQLPDSVLAAFAAYRGNGDDGRWGLGDRIEEVFTEFAGKVTLRHLYKSAALETEKSIAKVRVCHETARAFDRTLRDEFEHVLVFQHYRVLRFIDDRAKKQAYLAWCIESADSFNGRPAPP